MSLKPYSKFVNLLSTGATIVLAASFEAIDKVVTSFVGETLSDPVVYLVIGLSGLVSLLSHSIQGTGGEEPIVRSKYNEDKGQNEIKVINAGFTKNLMTR